MVFQDQALKDDVRGGAAFLERIGNAHKGIPLLAYELDVDGAAKEWVETAVGPISIDLVEHRVGRGFQSRHEVEAEQVAKTKEVLCCAVAVGVVFTRAQHRIVLEEPVKDVDRFAGRA